MFVMNCSVRMEEVLRYETSAQKKTKSKSRRRRQRDAAVTDCSQAAEAAADDVYHPVVCSVCNSDVGVYDSDEVYHFFNVLASYA